MSMVLLHVTRKNIAIKKQLTYATDFVEAIILWFAINNCIVTLENVYIAPHAPIEQLYSLVLYTIEKNYQNGHIFLVGEFNIDMLQSCNGQNAFSLLIHINNFSLHTTKVATAYGSMLDHFWKTFPSSHVKSQIFEAY